MNDNTTERQLARVPLLADVGMEQVRAIARIAARRRFDTGEIIFAQGDTGDALFIIISGIVQVSALSSAGAEVTLALLGPGESLGELSLLDGLPRSAGARALEATDVLVVRREHFLAWLREHPDASLALLRTLSQRLRSTDDAIADAVFLDVSQRVAKRLLWLSAERGAARVRITQQEIAGLLGVTREAVNKALRQFESHGWIELGRGSVSLVDAAALDRAATPQ